MVHLVLHWRDHSLRPCHSWVQRQAPEWVPWVSLRCVRCSAACPYHRRTSGVLQDYGSLSSLLQKVTVAGCQTTDHTSRQSCGRASHSRLPLLRIWSPWRRPQMQDHWATWGNGHEVLRSCCFLGAVKATRPYLFYPSLQLDSVWQSKYECKTLSLWHFRYKRETEAARDANGPREPSNVKSITAIENKTMVVKTEQKLTRTSPLIRLSRSLFVGDVPRTYSTILTPSPPVSEERGDKTLATSLPGKLPERRGPIDMGWETAWSNR